MRSGRGIAGLALGATLVLEACSSSSSPASPSSSSAPAGIAVKAANVKGVGTVLVDTQGRTLYMLTADTGGKVTCTSVACTAAWPPLLLSSGSPSAGPGATASLLSTATTPSGGHQVTYDRWPLYTYSGDRHPGQANGEGIKNYGGIWYAISPSGKIVKKSSSSGSGGY